MLRRNTPYGNIIYMLRLLENDRKTSFLILTKQIYEKGTTFQWKIEFPMRWKIQWKIDFPMKKEPDPLPLGADDGRKMQLCC